MEESLQSFQTESPRLPNNLSSDQPSSYYLGVLGPFLINISTFIISYINHIIRSTYDPLFILLINFVEEIQISEVEFFPSVDRIF